MRLVIASCSLIFSLSVLAQAPNAHSSINSETVQNGADYVSPAVTPELIVLDARARPTTPAWQPGDPIREIPRGFFGDTESAAPTPVNPTADGLDPLAKQQREFQAQPANRAFTGPLLNQNAQGNTGVNPADPSGDVGKNHYIQAINGSSGALYVIYNKVDGSVAAGSFSMEGLGTGVCASGVGDPIVMYDELADRWVLTEFSSSAGNALCMYVSATNNPVSTTWYRYTFVMPTFPDYPKYGVWNDAYYVAANELGSPRPMYAMDRLKMLAGTPATFQRVTTPRMAGFNFEVILPADVTGTVAPPTGARGLFLRHRDDEVHNAGANNPTSDFLDLFTLRVDFATPANTQLTGPIPIAISEFSSNLNGVTGFNVFPQPNGQRVDAVREVIMHRLGYRRFDTHEALIANFVTDVDGADTGGIRWVELRRTGGIEQPWVKYQEGTYAPADDGGPADRFMGSIAMDESGNLGLVYSITRQAPPIPLSLRYTGRLAGDSLGVMSAPETQLVAGVGSLSTNRWGDYFDLSVDPVDGCTFWFTGSYLPANTWTTRVASFRHESCGEPTFNLNGVALTQSVCANTASTALSRIDLDLPVVSGYTGDADLGFSAPLPTGISANFIPSTVFLPGSSSLRIQVANTAAPGTRNLMVQAISGRIARSLPVTLNISTLNPATVTLAAPANAAIDVALRPVFSWNAAAQAQSYVIEGSLSPTFGTLLFTQTISGGGTNFQPAAALPSNSLVYWRVRASNTCGTSVDSAVFSFRTLPAIGDCSNAQTTRVVFDDSIETPPSSWVASGASGTLPWAISSAQANSPTRSWKGSTPATTSEQWVDLPSVNVPSGALSASLRFAHWRAMESNSSTGCFDGGSLFASVNAGAFAAIPAAQILQNGASQRPLASGTLAWCGSVPWESVVVNASPYAGQNVRFRFRVTSDSSTSLEGWYVDDVRVQACLSDLIFANRFEN